MRITRTKLDGVLIIETDVFGDHRGFFTESYNKQRFHEADITHDFIQDNHSYSAEAGTLRGLHYQLDPKAQTKLVRVVAGAIYDVVVDIRRGSPTFGQWEGFIISESNKRQILVPRGFAHGFCTIMPHTQVMYKVDQLYDREQDCGILWSDPDLNIDWPMTTVTLSDKDKVHPPLKDAEINFTV